MILGNLIVITQTIIIFNLFTRVWQGLSQVQMQALTQHLERLMKQQSDGLHERLDQMETRKS